MLSPPQAIDPTDQNPALPSPKRALAWLLLFAVAFFLAAFVFFIGYGVYLSFNNSNLSAAEVDALMGSNGLSLNVIAAVYITQFAVLVPLVIVASNFPEQHWSQTLALRPVAFKFMARWLGVWGVFQVLCVILHQWVDIPVDDFIAQMAGSKNLLMSFVIIFLAPVLEELVFRGYLFKAWRRSWLGFSGTLLLTSTLFVLLHVGQYHPLVLLQLFVLALMLGVARERTGSVITPWLIHTVNNTFAVIALVFWA
ncbi:CPBP family intramembrane glutamic endopeptidase [Gilvimarinus sp. DA14]|uniref:CPBP family intramembrane glutamic endopeptidase n=1 Tax=Gilvimarinus sp. DA14 TaxID=2956798 RepID=UPI0020B7F8BE|nr:type II CAAX endopeptidase family protein [Gilvimarinus sp. DA14]UTF61302.1 CPBP family intramembrane metalloprotease [Gilvimarinus sp. DA14]